MSDTDLNDHEILSLEADFYEQLSAFNNAYQKYHDLIFVLPISKKQTSNLNNIIEGLKDLNLSFHALTQAYATLCQIKGIEISE